MKQIRLERKARRAREYDAVLPSDPRDPEVVRAKEALRRAKSPTS